MFHHLLRILSIAITAAILAGGAVAVATAAPIQPATPAMVESQPLPDTGAQTADSFPSVMTSTADPARRPPQDLPGWVRFSGIVGHIIVIALIIIMVTWVQKLITRLSAKPKTGMRPSRM